MSNNTAAKTKRKTTHKPETAKFITPAQAALIFQVSEFTVYEWLKHGNLSGRKIGGLWRIPATEVS